MARYTFPAFNKSPTPRYVVVWDLQWQLLVCRTGSGGIRPSDPARGLCANQRLEDPKVSVCESTGSLGRSMGTRVDRGENEGLRLGETGGSRADRFR